MYKRGHYKKKKKGNQTGESQCCASLTGVCRSQDKTKQFYHRGSNFTKKSLLIKRKSYFLSRNHRNLDWTCRIQKGP